MRNFDTGATRDTEDGKLDYEGFLAPEVLERYAEYMHINRYQKNGSIRDSDNWQKGIPKKVYMKSMFRHFFDVWKMHRGKVIVGMDMETALCALLFNVMGYLFEVLRETKPPEKPNQNPPVPAALFAEYRPRTGMIRAAGVH